MSRPLLLLALPVLAMCRCPFTSDDVEPPAWHPSSMLRAREEGATAHQLARYAEALARLDWEAVKSDIRALLTDSKDFWPADGGNYGPLFVRQAWHCGGSYRTSDGRGGCEGGHQRFEPERSWADNTNLDKARSLLLPIKLKYGLGLSWGDLIILAGTTAIEAMGGPVLGFCGGRVDSPDGSESAELGPSPIQEQLAPCPENGTCKEPLGSTTVGLIYLNPEGPMGKPDPAGSALDVRDAFGRMNMNDSETVALIAGGHAFGKTHGACPDGPGPSPKEDPTNPWPGKCGTGKGNDTFTSGFEFTWTSHPSKWGNQYIKNLVENKWEKHVGPGGHWQWRIENATGPLAGLGMLTSDMSLLHDPKGEYQKLVKLWAKDKASLDDAFAHAWYKVTTRDMGPVTRCVGNNVPPAQDWQYPLPPPPQTLADFDKVRAEVKKLLHSSSPILPADEFEGTPYYGALFVRLAWQCARTYRDTDHLGGCNGARIRFSPEKDWPVNTALDKTLLLLKPIKDLFADGLSWADLIVLAGTVAIEEAGGGPVAFCGGRSDAKDGSGSKYLEPRISGDDIDAVRLRDAMRVMGLSARDLVALTGGGHSLGKMHPERSGFEGSWTATPTTLDNSYFTALLTEQWDEITVASTGKKQFKAKGKELYMLKSDLLLLFDSEFMAIAEDYASDKELFLQDFGAAWARLMSADRFDGPVLKLCDWLSPEPRPTTVGPSLVV